MNKQFNAHHEDGSEAGSNSGGDGPGCSNLGDRARLPAPVDLNIKSNANPNERTDDGLRSRNRKAETGADGQPCGGSFRSELVRITKLREGQHNSGAANHTNFGDDHGKNEDTW